MEVVRVVQKILIGMIKVKLGNEVNVIKGRCVSLHNLTKTKRTQANLESD